MNETDNTPEKLWPVLGEPDWERISKIAKPSENLKFGGVLRGCWSEGEMVGYATCMIEQVKPLKQFIELNHNERLSALLSKQSAELEQLRSERDKMREALEFFLEMFKVSNDKYTEWVGTKEIYDAVIKVESALSGGSKQ